MATFVLLVLSRHLAARRWSEMDYGPFLTTTLEVERDNIAYKSIAIRLDPGEGGVSQGNVFVSFDTDTLRYAAGWTGRGLMDWRSVVYDGSHGTHPSLVGKRVFVNPVRPGWGRPARTVRLKIRVCAVSMVVPTARWTDSGDTGKGSIGTVTV